MNNGSPLNPEPLRVLPKYPHMLPNDTELWTRYLQRNPYPNAKVIYDLHIGTAALPPGKLSDNYAFMVTTLSKKRIDATVILPHETHVYEVKPYAGTSAIGQLLCYLPLLRREFPRLMPVYPYLLTDRAQADTPELCQLHAITLVQLDIE